MISFAQLEQLLRLLQPNANIGQTLAAMVTPPESAAVPQPAAAQADVSPPTTEAVAEIAVRSVNPTEPDINMGEERAEMAVGTERVAVMVDVRGIDIEIMDVREEEEEQIELDVGGAEVAPFSDRTEMTSVDVDDESARTEMATVDAGAGVVSSEMATTETEMEADAARVEADIAAIEAEIREEMVPTVELEERVDSGLGTEARVEEKDFIKISKSETKKMVQSVKEVSG